MVSRNTGAVIGPVSVRDEHSQSWLALAPYGDEYREFTFLKKDWTFSDSTPSELSNQQLYATLADGTIFTIVIAATGATVGPRMRINEAWYVDIPPHAGVRPVPMPINTLGSQFKIVTQ